MRKAYLHIFLLLALGLFSQVISAQELFSANPGIDTTFVYGKIEGYSSAPRNRSVNVLFIGDGYTQKEIKIFHKDTELMIEKMISTYPFSVFKDYINFYTVDVVSNESGVKHPRTSADSECSILPVADPDNYFGTSFDAHGIHRLLYPADMTKLSRLTAWYESYRFHQNFHITILMANSNYYGGAGGEIAVTTRHSLGAEVIVHELGHSFGGLADEYWQDGYEQEGPNKTQESNPGKISWKKFLYVNSIGIYPFEENRTWFRPHQSCKMRFNGQPFCDVCANEIVKRAKEITGLDEFKPIITSTDSPGDAASTSIRVYPNPASDLLYIESEENIKKVDIINHTGIRIRSFHNPGKMIPVNTFPDGMYFFIVQTQTKTLNMKVIVHH